MGQSYTREISADLAIDLDENWYSVDLCVPENDINVLIINTEIINMLPHKAYFDEKLNMFFSLESDSSLPILCTHWIFLPTNPFCENKNGELDELKNEEKND